MSRSIHPNKIEVKEVHFGIKLSKWKRFTRNQRACFAQGKFETALSNLPAEKDRFRIAKLDLLSDSPFVHCTLERGGCLTAIYCIATFECEKEEMDDDEKPDSVSFDERATAIESGSGNGN